MSRRPSSGRSASARNRSADSGRNCTADRQEATVYEMEESIEEDGVEVEPRYDPKELRDACKVFEPFLRLLGERNNPFASIVAKELCKTFYHIYHPGKHPVDVNKTIDWKAKEIRTCQLWTEFWQYTPDGEVKEWRSLWCAGGDLIDIDECRYQTPRPPAYKTPCPNAPKRSKKMRSRNKTRPSKPQAPSPCSLIQFDDGPGCRHQAAGSDLTVPSLPCTFDNRPPPEATTTDKSEELDSKRIIAQIADSKRELERLVDEKCLTVDPDQAAVEDNETSNPNRQPAGNDRPPLEMSYCNPGPSSRPASDAYDYYLRTGISPPLAQRNLLERYNGPDSTYPEESIKNDQDWDYENNACAPPIDENNLNGVEMPSCNSSFDEDIDFSPDMLDNLYTNVSLAEKELEKKKAAFSVLVDHYVEFAHNPMELEPPCPESPSAKRVLQAIYQNPPRILQPFDDSKWNVNALRDRDFVKLLPFFETVHNQLEYASKKQCEKSINMLDDVMSVLYHIYYEIGDPRLKNDHLRDHVRLVTKNTWKYYFYPDATRTMPEVPEKPLPQLNISYPPTPNVSVPHIPSPSIQSPVLQEAPQPPLPVQKPPVRARPAPKSPRHRRPSGHGPMGSSAPPPPPPSNQPPKRPQSANETSANDASTTDPAQPGNNDRQRGSCELATIIILSVWCIVRGHCVWTTP